MPRKKYNLEITIRDRVNGRVFFAGIDDGLFNNQFFIQSTEKLPAKIIKNESLAYATKLSAALTGKLKDYLRSTRQDNTND